MGTPLSTRPMRRDVTFRPRGDVRTALDSCTRKCTRLRSYMRRGATKVSVVVHKATSIFPRRPVTPPTSPPSTVRTLTPFAYVTRKYFHLTGPKRFIAPRRRRRDFTHRFTFPDNAETRVSLL